MSLLTPLYLLDRNKVDPLKSSIIYSLYSELLYMYVTSKSVGVERSSMLDDHELINFYFGIYFVTF